MQSMIMFNCILTKIINEPDRRDIQWNYRTLLALFKQIPDDDPVSVGDIIDRRPRSLKVLEFFRNHGKELLRNHEHMMFD